MADNFLDDSQEDLRRKYRNTWVSYKREKENIPFYVEDILADKTFKGLPARKKRSVTILGENVDVSWPSLGVVNTGKIAVLFNRRAPRTTTRGFIWDNVSYEIIARNSVALAAIEDPLLEKESIITDLFLPSYFSVKDAYEEIMQGKSLVRAINNKYWIGVSPFSEVPIFGYKQWACGRMPNNKQVQLSKHAKQLTEDISMYLEVI